MVQKRRVFRKVKVEAGNRPAAAGTAAAAAAAAAAAGIDIDRRMQHFSIIF